MDFFTSSWNLNHFGIIKYTNRPFNSVDEMNNKIIQNCNDYVKEDDRLFFVGDMVFGPLDDTKYLKTVRYFRNKIKCKNIFLIYGNHDRRARKEAEFRRHFVNCSDYLEIKSGDQSVILFHYPIESGCWNRAVTAKAWHVHGAVQDSPVKKEKGRFDVSIDNCLTILGSNRPEDYRPFSTDRKSVV